MTLFDLVFIGCFLGAAGTLARAIYAWIRGRRAQSWRIAQRLAACVAAYLVVLVSVSAIQPTRTIALGAPQCFDEWCLVIDSASRRAPRNGAVGGTDLLVVSGRVLNRGRGRRQRETDVSAELVDDRGARYATVPRTAGSDGAPTADGTGLTAFVEPAGSKAVTLSFEVPKAARSLAVVVRHGWFPHALIIADPQSLFHRPTVVPLWSPPTVGIR